MKIKDRIKNFLCSDNLFWLVIGAFISLSLEKACNRIIPDNPIVIKEISDSVRIIHSYDFNVDVDSLVNKQLKIKLENIALAQSYEQKINDEIKIKQQNSFNEVMLNAKFPNAKGYIIENGMPFFVAKMPSFQENILDFRLEFFDSKVVSNIYCISIKIDAIKNNNRVMVLDENYKVNCQVNNIRMTNNLSAGVYNVAIGFFYKEDRESITPRFYQISKTIKR